MQTIKIITIPLLSVTLALLLSACNTKTTQEETNATNAQSPTIEQTTEDSATEGSASGATTSNGGAGGTSVGTTGGTTSANGGTTTSSGSSSTGNTTNGGNANSNEGSSDGTTNGSGSTTSGADDNVTTGGNDNNSSTNGSDNNTTTVGNNDGNVIGGVDGNVTTGGSDDNTTASDNDTNTSTGGGTTDATLTLTSLRLESNTTTVNKGETVQLSVMGTYSDNSTKAVDENVSYTITPADSAKVDGTILTALKDGNVMVQATVGGVTSNSVKLHITWVVDGHVLPPEPDPAINNSTLLGIDSNNNGVRDDVERWIYKTYDHPIERGIFMQSARAYQKVIVDPSKAHETVRYSDNVLSCEFYWIYEKHPKPFDKYEHFSHRKNFKRIQFNTLDRHMAYERYNAQFNGEVFGAPPASKEKCEFDENGILKALK